MRGVRIHGEWVKGMMIGKFCKGEGAERESDADLGTLRRWICGAMYFRMGLRKNASCITGRVE